MKILINYKYISLLILIVSGVFIFSSFNSPEEQIIGTWMLENSSPEYKLIFTNNGICKEYEDNELLTTYSYSLENNSCESYAATATLYLKLIDNSDQSTTCFELSSITDNTLSLMIIDKGKMMLFNKE